MISQEHLKRLGIFGVAFGLVASPLTMADMHEEEAEDPAIPTEESEPTDDSAADPGGTSSDPGADPAADSNAASSDPAADPAADPNATSADPGQPADDEPGFGGDSEPMPDGSGGEGEESASEDEPLDAEEESEW